MVVQLTQAVSKDYCFSMALAQQVLLTADDYRLLPETGPQYQLIEGELFMAPAPWIHHQNVLLHLALQIGNYLAGNRKGALYVAPVDVYFGAHNVFQPDLVYVAHERKHIVREDGVHGAPTLVIEILSPNTKHLDRNTKRKVYAASGVEELWIVDPAARRVELFRLQENPEQPAGIYGGKDTFTSSCFPGLQLRPSEIFQR